MRCKHCKTKFEPKYFNQKYCMGTDECISAFVAYSKEVTKKNNDRKWKKEKSVLKVETHSKENKKHLQDGINKLSRMIDEMFEFNCIDCGIYLDKTKHQIDACHLISRGSNSTIKYHLDNLHSGHNHCNVYNPKHETNYRNNIVSRYGKEYLELIDNLPLKYKEIDLSNQDVSDKLKLVRSIIRNFKTYKFESSLHARNIINNLIGIYK